ncbi:MAG: hypothetical protein NXI04_22070 [Planctomycetaceae bacterium]|nr:hypothetical protein [Planctomycetaceae bacterium]
MKRFNPTSRRRRLRTLTTEELIDRRRLLEDRAPVRPDGLGDGYTELMADLLNADTVPPPDTPELQRVHRDMLERLRDCCQLFLVREELARRYPSGQSDAPLPS